MKIALIQCPVWGTYDPPLALAQLSGCLKKAGHEVSCFDLNIRFYINRTISYKDSWAWEQSLFWYNEERVDRFFEENKNLVEKYISELMATGARIMGFSVNAASRLSSLKVAKMIKDIDKDIIIVFGGQLFFEKRFIEEILKKDYVDIVIPGEGEITFIELAHSVEIKKDITNCDGIFFKKKGTIVNTRPREPIENLDILPFMDFTDLPLSRYDDSRHIAFMASRGCVQRCVFCSSRAFWPKYRAMSGRRIFEEVKYHKVREGGLNPHLGHVDFIDLVFNGNMRHLIEFCNLMAEERLDIKWSANMIIRPEMTREVIEKMKDSGCEHIIFGLESGSQHVLDLMKKHYQIEDADRIIRDMHEVGIRVTGNFMFGFPGETKEDFKQTLDFIKRNSRFLDRAYPSRTYCAIEEFSYLADHLEEFGIKPNPPNHLFWESIDGVNTYPERLGRCREFSQLASSLGIDVGCGVQTSVDLDEFFNLYLYYEQKKDMKNALEYLLKYFDLNRINEHVKNTLQFYLTKVNENDPLFVFNEDLLSKLKKAVSLIEVSEVIQSKGIEENKDAKDMGILSIKDNSNLNDAEFNNRELSLDSLPKRFFIEVNGPRNYSFIFDKVDTDYDLFSLKAFRTRFEEKMLPFMSKAEEIIFFGDGEFLLLGEAEDILAYFDNNLPNSIKVFSTNGSSLSPTVCEKISACRSKFTINILLPAFSREQYLVMAHNDNLFTILQNLEHLLKIRKDPNKLQINILFTATTLNIDEFPSLVKLAADLGVNKIICQYTSLGNETHRYLSCFFRQPDTNRAISEAIEVAKRLNIKIDLPPRFMWNDYQERGMCRLPWSQIMFDTRGKVLLCVRSNRFIDSMELKTFFDIWNGENFQKVRKIFAERNCPYYDFCIQANPSAVNRLDAHRINCESACNIFSEVF